MLELHEAGGAFEALDAYLEDEGSGGRDGVVADPYDLARVCVPGSVGWPELMGQREVAGVTQLVSRVERALRPQASLGQMPATTFPGGSVTGASKIAAPRAHLWVGGGIVCDSEPEAEIEESWIERPLLAAVGGLVAA